MGKKLNLTHLSDDECDKIMRVLQKDFEVRKSEKKRLNEVHDALLQEQTRISLLQQKHNFNQSNCIVCLERFGFFSRRKRLCDVCKLNACQACCSARPAKKDAYICVVCNKEKAYKMLSNEWFRKNFHLEEKHYGSSKIVRSLYKRNTSLSDTEMDSGYPHSSPGSAHWPKRSRPRLDNVFDIEILPAATSTPKLDEDDAFGLSPFTELPNQSTTTPVSNRPSLRATSLESIIPTSPSSKTTPLSRSATPIGTQTHIPRVAGQPIATQTSLDVGDSAAQTTEQANGLSTVSTGTETADLGGKTPATTVSKAVETSSSAPQFLTLDEGGSREVRNNNLPNGTPLVNGATDLTQQQHAQSSHLVTSEPLSERITSETSDPAGERSRRNSGGGARPRSGDYDSLRKQRRRDKETKGLYREAFDGAKRAEEFKFRLKFDQFLGDLHGALDERSPHGLPASFASPSYGEVMLLFRDKVKDLLKGFTHRLQLAHESFGNVESPEDTSQKVKQDVSKFIEDLIGETLDLTSDEAVSDLSSLSDEASPDQQTTFEDLLAQAVVTKLLENHRKAVKDSLEPGNDNDHLNHFNHNLYSRNNSNTYNNNHRYHSLDHIDRVDADQIDSYRRESHYTRPDFPQAHQESDSRLRNFISLDHQDFAYGTSTVGSGVDNRDFQSSDGGSRDFRASTGDVRGSSSVKGQHPRDAFGGNRQVSVTSLRTDHSLTGDGGGLYSRTLSNQNLQNTSGGGDTSSTLLIPRTAGFSSDEDDREEEEGEESGHDVSAGSRRPRRSRNSSNSSAGGNSSSNNNHGNRLRKTGKQLSTSSTSSLEPETAITRDTARSLNASAANESSASEDQHTPVPAEWEESGEAGEAISSDRESEADPEKDFLELKDFVRRTQQTARPKVEVKHLAEDAVQGEVQEEELLPTSVDRDEEREQFHARYSVFDRVHNAEPVLPDFSQFENIDFGTNEIDPDLLSMNLAIIPEETEEELEQEEDEDEDGRWRNNWIFKGKGVSVYDNLGKKKVGRLDQDGPLIMMVPRPEDEFVPRVGNRDVDQLSDFSEGDLLTRSDLDNTDEDDDDDDDDENSFYANTSKELARIAGRRLRAGRERKGSGSSARRWDNKLIPGLEKDHADLDDEDGHMEPPLEDIPGPIVQPVKPEVKLLYDLIPADGDDPKFLTPPESVTVQEGDPVQFTCRVGGTQPFDVFWYREGDEVEELEEGEDVEMGSNGDKYWMTLYHVGRKQAGQYMCIALSDKGKAIQYLVVSVKDNKQELKKPEFLKGLKDVDITEGESVKFRVKVKGFPQPRVTWFKDGQLLKASRSCRIEKFGNRDYILTIDYATMDDDAEYTVSARNVAGTEKLSAQVIVEPRSELPPRRQLISSVNTSAASDSDSDISGIYKRRSYNLSNNSNNKFSTSTPTSSPLLLSARRAPSPTSPHTPQTPEHQQAEVNLPSSLSGQNLPSEGARSSEAASSLIDSLPLSLTAAPSPRTAMQERENELNLSHLDRKVTLTQRRVEEEALKMEEDAQKVTKMTNSLDDVDDRLASLEVSLPSFAAYGRDWAINNRNLWNELNAERGGRGGEGGGGGGRGLTGTPSKDDNSDGKSLAAVKEDVMAAAEEILRLEAVGPDPDGTLTSADTASDDVPSAPGDAAATSLDLDLPDELDDFPLPGAAKSKAAPVKSTFTMSVGGSENNNNNNAKGLNDDEEIAADWEGRRARPADREKFKSEVSFPQHNAKSSSSSGSTPSASSSTTTREPPISPLHQRQHTAATAAGPTTTGTTTNLINVSFDSGQGGSLAGGENSASLASSVSSSTSSLGGGGAGEVDDGQVLSPSRVKGRYARDFEVAAPLQQQQQNQQNQQQQQKKKWSVTLDPFSPQAEVVNKQRSSMFHDPETPEVDIQVTYLSSNSSSSVPSTPSQVSPAPARPPPRERAAPVHMVGTSSEDEVPESRTEFNTDGSVELPSVNRLKALFSGNKDDMLGEGNFKRVHSITARSVSKQQLEKLRTTTNPIPHSSLPPSLASSLTPAQSSLSPNRRSPLSIPQTSPSSLSSLSSSSPAPHPVSEQRLSSASLQLSFASPPSSSSSSALPAQVTLRPVPAPSADKQQEREEKPQRRRSSLIEDGSYLEVDDGKDPILIYPERDPEYWKRQHKLLLQERQLQQQQQQRAALEEEEEGEDSQSLNQQPSVSSQKSARAPSPPQTASSLSSSSSSSSTAKIPAAVSVPPTKSPRTQQPRLVVRRATSDINLDALESAGSGGGVVTGRQSPGAASGTRIKAGCISARAAFWEKKMMEGAEGVSEDEFPEMVEESDS